MTALPELFLDRPIAHRALHGDNRPENSLEAIEAACANGYGIEIDLQLSKDDQAMVFHDYDLRRLTGKSGPVRQQTAAELGEIPLTGGQSCIPTLAQVLDLVNGRAPLLIELKDQDGGLGPDIGPLESATATALAGYDGPVALMSFNPHSVARLAELCPDRPRGLTSCAYAKTDWPLIRTARLEELRDLPDIDRIGASFVSHQHTDLGNPRIAALKAAGLHILCWTIRSAQEEVTARQIADNVTFESYIPA